MSDPDDENSVSASLDVRLQSEQSLHALKSIAGLTIGALLQGKPEENFAFDTRVRIETRTAMAAMINLGGVKVVSANINVPRSERSRWNWWSNDYHIYLRGMEEALGAETKLQKLHGDGRLDSQSYEHANWMLKRIVQILRRDN